MAGIFTDDRGNKSSIRVFSAVIIAVVLFNWTYATVRTGVWQPLDLDSALALAGALVAKVGQKFAETDRAGNAQGRAGRE
ncbi:hypothetical protein [Desulfolutivibrio sulfoxidireducens]|uniref:hypothetical protein n=1 Tax=Desulfolutivibrio sulfoxidireducens TaxID=2773299 RepID=UPI00159E9B4A|nr:hypothetical protein [Desulfolutivibrio sulfoxidireducens]QLA17718.1 hypothetical protein GD605_17350 [Desulfolutivibrio sulfoxidireducens]QLA21292.1 hypothetical protein GD604_16960 [Desulfolutivibrio sulfoxidireducens]